MTLRLVLIAFAFGCNASSPDGPPAAVHDDTDSTGADTDPLVETCASGMTTVTGDVRVETAADLEALRCVDEITGALRIEHTAVTHLNDLASLARIGGGILIKANVDLVSLNGLRSLTTVQDLGIGENLSLTSLHGLEGVTTVEGSLFVGACPLLESLDGLAGLTRVDAGMGLTSNDALASLGGLHGLRTVSGPLAIAANDHLTSLSGLDGLDTLTGPASIFSNFRLCASEVEAFAARLGVVCDQCTDNGPDLRDCPPAPGRSTTSP